MKKILLVLIMVVFIGCDGDTVQVRVVDDRIACPEMYVELEMYAIDGAICRKYGHMFNDFTDKCDICEVRFDTLLTPRKPIKIRDGDIVIPDTNLYSICNQLNEEKI